MMLPLVATGAARGRRTPERYAAWLAAVRRLRDAWQRGERPAPGQLCDLLTDVPEEQRGEALGDLVGEHLKLAWQAGRGATLDAYAPALRHAGFHDPAADLIEEEFLARHARPHGDAPGLAEYERRFPGRADVSRRLSARLLAGGRFVLLRRRGLGAFGEVWQAWDRGGERFVAVKRLRPDHARDGAVRARFENETHRTAGLDHPAIAGVTEQGEDAAGAPFLVLRWAPGRSLATRIAESRRDGAEDGGRGASRDRLLASFVALCRAIAHAHARGVMHGDLKPGNVMVDDDGATAVLDWGLAASLPGPAEAVQGTPEYMAPEQARGAGDARSDVFSLGAVLYEILTGRPPHAWPDGVRPVDWREAVARSEFQPPRGVDRSVPRGLDAICRKALARSPADRYASAEALAEAVERHLAPAEPGAWAAMGSQAVRLCARLVDLLSRHARLFPLPQRSRHP